MGRHRLLPIGIDFGEHAVKVAQVECRGETLQLREARTVRVHAGPDEPEAKRARLIDAARLALRSGRFRGKQVVCALRLAQVTLRHIRVPAEHLEQAGEYLTNEIREHPVDGGGEFTICPIPVADLLEHGEQKREYMCCIASSTAIQELIGMVEELALVPVAIDLETCAQVRPFLAEQGDASFVHLDLGCNSSRITVVKSGLPVLMRNTPIGCTEMLATLTNRLQVDLATILNLAGSTDEDLEHLEAPVTSALAEQLDLILRKIADCVRYCGALFQGRAVTLLRVAGGIAHLPGVVPYLGRRVGIRAELADPLAGMQTGDWQRVEGFGTDSYATALGLSLRGLVA